MASLVSRRGFLAGCTGLLVSGAPVAAQNRQLIEDVERLLRHWEGGRPQPAPGEELSFDYRLLPPAESEIDFPVPRISLSGIAERNRPQMVDFIGTEPAGSLVVDPDNRFLYHVLAYGQARRYGVGVGRQGFAWQGEARVGMKRRWPRWVPPRAMVERDPRARKWMNGQPGGPDNPLGARALYLFANGRDTLYRIHGTNEPDSIGKAVSSGCIRMLNQDIAELYDRVRIDTIVNVRPSRGGEA
jgi:lipoprotein-anchoring transpeptidase ErfK/SrfK